MDLWVDRAKRGVRYEITQTGTRRAIPRALSEVNAIRHRGRRAASSNEQSKRLIHALSEPDYEPRDRVAERFREQFQRRTGQIVKRVHERLQRMSVTGSILLVLCAVTA
jgi:predicted nucleotidyltransferase